MTNRENKVSWINLGWWPRENKVTRIISVLQYLETKFKFKLSNKQVKIQIAKQFPKLECKMLTSDGETDWQMDNINNYGGIVLQSGQKSVNCKIFENLIFLLPIIFINYFRILYCSPCPPVHPGLFRMLHVSCWEPRPGPLCYLHLHSIITPEIRTSVFRYCKPSRTQIEGALILTYM